MKNIISTILPMVIATASFAQLHSSGNNLIGGNNVGIGTSTPTDRLEIKSQFDPSLPTCITCPPPSAPGIRFQTAMTGALTPTTHYWDINAEQSLSFSHKLNSSSETDVLTMTEDVLEVLTNDARITSNVTFSSLPAAFNANSILGLGVVYNNSSSNWQTTGSNNQGTALISKNNGSLEVRTGVNTVDQTENALVVRSNGNVGIGVANPGSRLVIGEGDLKINQGRFVVSDGNANQFEVDESGYVVAREILVDMNEPIPDYVFSEDYDLMKLEELREFLIKERHLPNIPSASEYQELGGVELGELSRLLLEKQEELVLYILELEDRIAELETQNKE